LVDDPLASGGEGMKAKFVIVGGGVMGVSIAWHAAARADSIEEPIVLLEKKALAAGSSGRSGAILRQHYSQREVASMARDSLKVFADFEKKTGRSIGFQRTGVLTIAGPDRAEDVALIRRNVEMQVSIGIDTRLVGAAEMRRLVPGISVAEDSVGAYEPGGGGVDPVATVHEFAALAREKGAITRIGVGATKILARGGRVVGVDTEDGPIEAEKVVVAAGPWTRSLLLDTGVDLPLRAVKPEQLFLAMPKRVQPPKRDEGEDEGTTLLARGREELAPAAHPVVLDLEHGFYARCESHASPLGFAGPRTRVGRMDYAEDEEIADPDAVDDAVGGSFRAWAREGIAARIGTYRDLPEVGAFCGMYTLSPDAQALVGPLRDLPGLLVVSGFSGHGFKLSPSIGEGVAQMLWDEPVSAFDADFFEPERFRSERLQNERAREGTARAFGL
jgi:glycine/D-amino acid oxidase-like deaminating enzyme